MSNRVLTSRKLLGTLPGLVLVAMTATLILSSTAVAEEPPIVSVGPTDVGGTTASGTVGSDADADACVGDQHSGADPADPSVLQLNDTTCTSGGGTTTTGGTQGASGGGSTGPAGSAGASGSAGKAGAFASVAAADAMGLRIVSIRKVAKNVRLTRNFRLFVTLKDARGLRVRGAIVSISRVPGSRSTVSGMHAGFSNKVGTARVVVPVTKQMFGKRVFLKVAARTPKARAVALRSVLLPRLR